MDDPRERDRLLPAALILAAVVVVVNAWAIRAEPSRAFVDFQAFYCGARATLAHANPYLVEPLRSCELGITVRRAWHVLPAPLPGYVFLAFAPLAALPYVVAAYVWFSCMLAAMGATARLLRDMTGLPLSAIVAVLALGEGYTALDLGQPVPVVVLAIVGAATALTRGRPALVGVLASAALIEPHLGAAAVGATILFVPRARFAAIAGTAVLVAGSLLYLGTVENAQYVGAVLHAQAIAEASAWNQYSTTVALTALGVSAERAVAIGSMSLVLVMGLALSLAPLVARRIGNPAAIVLFPVAAAALGGPYIHAAQLPVAVPFALLLASGASALPVAALVALAIPVDELINYPVRIVPLGLLATAILALALLEPERRRVALRLCTSAFALCMLTLVLVFSLVRHHPSRPVGAVAPAALASESWQIDERMREVSPGILFVAVKLPAWAALIVVLSWPFTTALRRREPSTTQETDARMPAMIHA